MNRSQTYFGARRVAQAQKAELVRDLFSRVAADYDRMNDYMSLGAHRAWKEALVARLRPRASEHFLDLAGGSGDLGVRLARTRGVNVTVADLTPAMLVEGRARALNRGVLLDWVEADAENLPFARGTFDGVALAFGLRNMARPERALGEVVRVLKTGGRVGVLEFSTPDTPVFAEFYRLWARRALPALARAVDQRKEDYLYLSESIATFADAPALAEMMRAAGLHRISSQRLALGLVGLHLGYKSACQPAAGAAGA